MEPTFFVQKIAIQDNQDKILFLKRSDYKSKGANMWDLPGGSVDFAEDSKESIKRECREEVNIKLNSFKPIDVFSRPAEPSGQYIFITYFSNDFEGELKLSEEHTEYKWCTKEEFENLDLFGSVLRVKDILRELF